MINSADILTARILVVDDKDADVRLLEGMLRIAGYASIDSTTDPNDVCELHRKNRYGLILLDLKMPGMDGFQVMEGLKEIEEDGSLPVLVITAHPDQKLAALRAGAKDFVSKPFDLAELIARVHNILEMRLLHLETKKYSKVLEETVRELEASREVIRLKTLEERKRSEQEFITESRRAEEALRDSKERYRQLFESNPDPTFVFDQETLNFVAVNEAAVQEYGYSREELLSLTSKEIWPSDDIPAFIKRLSESPYGPPQGTTWKHQKKDRTTIDVEITRRALLFEGTPAWVMVAHNVTDRRLLEEQLRQSQKMDAVGQLAGGVAHDFNNLLTVINGYCDLALLRLPAQDPFRRDMEQIKRAGERAAALTRQLSAFSRRQVLLTAILDLNAVISELEKMLHRLIGEDIVLRTDLSPETGCINADRGQIEQIVMNLVVNARDAMPSGGELTIETQKLDLTGDHTWRHAGVNLGPHVMLTVADTGVGMDAYTQSRMFEPFFTTKEAGKGTGLGLSTVYGIVQQSGGSVSVHSKVGRGTTFKVFLPRTDDAPGLNQETTAPAGAVRGTETILLAEDDDMVRALSSRVLSTYGYRVLEAANGEAAILIGKEHSEPIHLLITDVVMPRMNGRDLADWLGRVRPGLKILYMSGYTDKAIVHQQVLDDRTPFIQKPFAPLALVNKVREVLDKLP